MKKYLLMTGLICGALCLASYGLSRGYAHAARWTALVEAARAAALANAVEPLAAQVPASAEAVTWTNLANCTLTGRVLRKTRGSHELTDAGGNSTQTIGGKNSKGAHGFVEFRAVETNKERYLGLTKDFAGTTHTTIDFALHLTSLPYRGATVAEVRENDVYKSETGYQPNDVFRIAVENGAIKYYRNGNCFYTSENKPSYPLVVDCSMLQIGATVADVYIASTAAAAMPVIADKMPPVQANLNALPLAGDLVTATPSFTASLTGLAGLPENERIMVPANYTTFSPPAVGGQFVDSVFGTTITRLSDGMKQFKDGVHHEYATMSAFNRDNTMIFLQGDNTGYFIVDRNGKMLMRLEFSNSAEPRWSHTENDVFYYHEDNRLLKYSVTARRATTVAMFSQYERITFGGGESDISEDGDHLMIAGDMRHVGVFTLSTGKLGRVIDMSALNGWAEVYITANNNVAVRWEEDGEGKYQGMGLFDGNMTFIRKVLPFGAHGDQARDVNGDEIIVMGAYRDLKPPPGCENSGVEKVRLSDSKKTCILPLDWFQEIHVSANSNGKHSWVLVSGTDVKGTADLPNKLKPDWQKGWRVRVNELILLKTDGSERRRIAHHRSRVAEFYWWQPRASLSKDARFALFDSNFGYNPLKDYTDTFLVNLTNQK